MDMDMEVVNLDEGEAEQQVKEYENKGSMAEEVGMFVVRQTVGSVLCCKCGIPMAPNGFNMCVKCLRSEVDILEGLQKNVIICHCPECECYLNPPRTWIKAQWESKELLAFCLNRLKKLKEVSLVHAEFVWTEPNSKRIKVKLKVQKKFKEGAVLEQSYVVEYVQHVQMCESCTRVAANPDQWIANVQLRQHVSHRRTFFYLEQLILKHDAAVDAVKIKQMDQGMDFFFASRSHAMKFVDFIGTIAPVKRNRKDNKQLVSQDSKSSTYNYKYAFSVEIAPICREDLICLPPRLANSYGNFGPLVICTKVTHSIGLLDPLTLRYRCLDGEQYYRSEFKSLLNSRQLVEYIVLYVEEIYNNNDGGGSTTAYKLADVQIARVSDWGKNDKIFTVRTHLGHILKEGDYALGYDLYGANLNSDVLDKHRGLILPEAILVKKSYEEKRQKRRPKPRPWRLKKLDIEVDEETRIDEEKKQKEYEEFLRDLEENPELRFNISLYRHNKDYQSSSETGDELPSVPLEELLADLDLTQDEDGFSPNKKRMKLGSYN